MRASWVIAKREIFAFFVSPLAYVVIAAWLIWNGVVYAMLAMLAANQPIGGSSEASILTQWFGGTVLFYIPLVAFVPMLTMRLLAEESSRGTIESLLTAPVNEFSLVMGKFMAAMVFWTSLWVPTPLYVWITSQYGDVDMGVVAASYLAVLSKGVLFMSLGLMGSAIARTQITAAVLTFMMLGLLFVVGLLSFVVSDESYRTFFEYVSMWTHMRAFSRGIVESRYLIYDWSFGALAIFATIMVVRWRRFEG